MLFGADDDAGAASEAVASVRCRSRVAWVERRAFLEMRARAAAMAWLSRGRGRGRGRGRSWRWEVETRESENKWNGWTAKC